MRRSRRHNKLKGGIFEAEITALSHDMVEVLQKLLVKLLLYLLHYLEKSVKFEYTFTKVKFDEAKVVEYIKKSPSRVTPPCDYFEICGGCSLQHMSTASQIEHKQQTLLNHLKYIGNNVEPENILPPLYTNNTEGYRNKARLVVYAMLQKEQSNCRF